MITFEKAVAIASGFDIITLVIEDQQIVQKNNIESYVPGSALVKKAEKYITVGSDWEKNPTCWAAFEGAPLSSLPDWQDRLAKVLTNSQSLRVNWSDLDNNTRVATVASEISVLATNCRALTPSLIKEVKCAKIFTAFGQIDLALS